MEVHPLVCYGDQTSLTNALSSRDIDSFRRALHSPTEIEKFDIETSMTIFEKACQTPGCAQFIEECILAGCDVNKINPELNKRPINFVVESQCEENLAALLNDPSVDVNARGSMNKTPINFLCEQISDENFRRLFPCIKLLIQYGADVNLPNNREVTPIINILKNRQLSTENKKTLVKHLLHNVIEVDFDTFRKGEARELMKKILPDIEVPNKSKIIDNDNIKVTPRHRMWDFNSLYLALKSEKEDDFLNGLDHLATRSPDTIQELFAASENRETLLSAAVSQNLTNALQKIISMGANVNYCVGNTVDPLPPIKVAAITGHWKCLEMLLKSPDVDVNAVPLLPIVVRKLGIKSTNRSCYENCFDILLKHRNIDINQMDLTGSTALHYAVKFNNSKAALELLKHGAYFGVKNHFNQLAISNINPKVLEKHFDSCITTNELRPSDDNFEIGFNYKNFVTHQNGKDDNFPNEMAAIQYISETNELKQLIMHPLVGSFLSLKWNRLAVFFYVNFFLIALFALTTVPYILMYYDTKYSDALSGFLRIVIFLLTIYIAIREMLQLIFSWRVYLSSMENYLECTLVVLVMLILFDVCTDTWRRIFAASTILLISIEIFLLAGSLPFWSFSCHYVMLKTVTGSFLKSLSLYAIILIAFSLSFYTLLHEPKTEASNPEKQDNGEDDDEFNRFTNVGLSILKTLVMSTGEFDVASINFKLNSFSYVIFTVFLFLVTIVLVNLLNGLAVSDTQAIKSEAELTNFVRRSQVLARYDGVLTAGSCPSCFKMMCTGSNAFDDLKSISHIRVKPNDNNQILIPEWNVNDEVSETGDNLRPLKCMHIFSCSDPCARMDSKIVKFAIQVVEKNAQEEAEENVKEQMDKRITKIEHTLDVIVNKLNELTKK